MRPVAVSGAGVEQPELQLAQRTSSIYQLDRHDAVAAGFSLGSVSVQGDCRLLVIDVARTALEEIAAKRRSETWGYGYRLLVEISDIKGMGSLTLPPIAAKVELGEVEASVRLQVNGFVGPNLWKELPGRGHSTSTPTRTTLPRTVASGRPLPSTRTRRCRSSWLRTTTA